MFTDIKCSLNWIINIFSSISELFLLCTTCASSPLKMTRRKMELNSPWPWHFSIAFLASFPQHPCCDSLVSSQHLFLPMVPGKTSWGFCFLKGKGRNPTKPKRDKQKWALNQNFIMNFLCMFWLRKKVYPKIPPSWIFHSPLRHWKMPLQNGTV